MPTTPVSAAGAPVPVFAAAALAALQRASRPDQSTTAMADLALEPVFTQDALAPWLGERAAAPVLVIEDDREIRTVVCQALAAEGLPVEAVSDGEAALARVADHQPALVVLDLGLPRIHGSFVAAGVRAHYGDRVPLVVLSASPPDLTLLPVPTNAYLIKPFDLDDLVGTVHRLLAA